MIDVGEEKKKEEEGRRATAGGRAELRFANLGTKYRVPNKVPSESTSVDSGLGPFYYNIGGL